MLDSKKKEILLDVLIRFVESIFNLISENDILIRENTFDKRFLLSHSKNELEDIFSNIEKKMIIHTNYIRNENKTPKNPNMNSHTNNNNQSKQDKNIRNLHNYNINGNISDSNENRSPNHHSHNLNKPPYCNY